MSARWLRRSGLVALAIAFAVSASTRSAGAQCLAEASSCRKCHQAGGRGALGADAPWHADHAFAHFCAQCHGGDPTTSDEAVAHATLGAPLDERGTRCATCHDDGAERLRRYVSRRAVEHAAVGPIAPATGGQPPTPPPNPAGTRSVNRVLALIVVALGLALGELVRRARRRPEQPEPTEGQWTPYAAGALLGLLAAASMALLGRRLSGGGAYQYLAALVGRVLAPHSVYFHHVVPARADFELTMVGGAVLGAFVAARTSGAFRIRTMPDSQWTAAFGPSVAVRWCVGFLGAALTEFAAGVAGGCTASLAVSGGAALAPGAFAFMAGMFGGGIPTALLVYRRRQGR